MGKKTYELEITKHLQNRVEYRYAGILRLWFAAFLEPGDIEITPDEICIAMRNQTNWMDEPFRYRFEHTATLAMAIRNSDNVVIATISIHK